MSAFKYNPHKEHYPIGGVYKPEKNINLTSPNIFWRYKKGDYFPVKFPNIFEKYIVTISSEQEETAWENNPMQFWQNQLHFALWIASSGSGVSFTDHLSSVNELTKSLFHFHVYYQTRRILEEMNVPLPQDPSFDANNNPFDRKSYERICDEFNIPVDTKWHAHASNHGMGEIYTYDKRYAGDKRYSEYKHTFDSRKLTFDKIAPPRWIPSDTFSQVFTPNKGHWSKPDKKQIAHIKQSKPYWKTFILDKSEGFTKAGVVRINDSIRTYVWALLGAQAQIRAPIDAPGLAFEVQKQFLANVEDRISSPVDIPASIKRYQDVLEDASSKLDYVFGIGLYLAPSNMKLKMGNGTTKGYNNRIMIADRYRTLGVNPEINRLAQPQHAPEDGPPEDGPHFITSQAIIQTKVNGILAPKGFTEPERQQQRQRQKQPSKSLIKKEIPQEENKQDVPSVQGVPRVQGVPGITRLTQMKDAIVIGGILCGLYVLWQ